MRTLPISSSATWRSSGSRQPAAHGVWLAYRCIQLVQSGSSSIQMLVQYVAAGCTAAVRAFRHDSCGTGRSEYPAVMTSTVVVVTSSVQAGVVPGQDDVVLRFGARVTFGARQGVESHPPVLHFFP